MPNRIVIIEDEPVARVFFRTALEDKYEVQDFASVEESLDALPGADLVLSDWAMPGPGGEGLLRLLDQMESPPPVIIVSGLSFLDARLAEVRSRGIPLLPKPLSLKSLLTAVAEKLPVNAT
jgi:DNA-binding NtrC family response regulator